MKLQDVEEHVFDLCRRACANGWTLTDATRLAAEVYDRAATGRSWDCDAYRALADAARPAVPYVEVDRETVVDHTTRLSFSVRVF